MCFSEVCEVREVMEGQKHVCDLHENQRINRENCIRKLDGPSFHYECLRWTTWQPNSPSRAENSAAPFTFRVGNCEFMLQTCAELEEDTSP